MDVNAVGAASGGIQKSQNQNSQGQNQNNQGQSQNVSNHNPGVINDIYEPSAKASQNNMPDMARVQAMWDDHNQQVESFRRLFEGLLNKQGQTWGTAESIRGFANPWSGEMVEIDDETRLAAQEAIGEGGYFSVEETAKRILNFAVALSGGDASKLDMLERAAMKGFAAAERTWGRELPEISQQTMQAVRDGFEQWRQAGTASAITLLQ